jgi:hypothetical protein
LTPEREEYFLTKVARKIRTLRMGATKARRAAVGMKGKRKNMMLKLADDMEGQSIAAASIAKRLGYTLRESPAGISWSRDQ